MNATDLLVAGGAGLLGFGIIWGLFALVRQQKAPPLEIFKTQAGPDSPARGAAKLNLAELGQRWHQILGVTPAATPAEIEAGYRARLAECDRVRMSPDAGAPAKQGAEERRAQVNDAYEFIRQVRR